MSHNHGEGGNNSSAGQDNVEPWTANLNLEEAAVLDENNLLMPTDLSLPHYWNNSNSSYTVPRISKESKSVGIHRAPPG
jgi:hypothetical protein